MDSSEEDDFVENEEDRDFINDDDADYADEADANDEDLKKVMHKPRDDDEYSSELEDDDLALIEENTGQRVRGALKRIKRRRETGNEKLRKKKRELEEMFDEDEDDFRRSSKATAKV